MENVVQMAWPFILMGVIFYFMIYRPQKRDQKKRANMLDSLKVGTRIVTIGGIFGEIAKIKDDRIRIKVAEDVEIWIRRAAVGTVITTELQKAAKEEKSFSQISGLFEKNSKYEKENKEFYDDLKEQLSSKDGYKADQITTDNYEGKYVISGVTGVVRGTLSYDYKVTYQKEDVTVGNMNGTVDGSSQMSAEFVYKDGNYQLRTVNPGSIWYRESQ